MMPFGWMLQVVVAMMASEMLQWRMSSAEHPSAEALGVQGLSSIKSQSCIGVLQPAACCLAELMG